MVPERPGTISFMRGVAEDTDLCFRDSFNRAGPCFREIVLSVDYSCADQFYLARERVKNNTAQEQRAAQSKTFFIHYVSPFPIP